MRRTQFEKDCARVREIFMDDKRTRWTIEGLCEFWPLYRGEERPPVSAAYMRKILAYLAKEGSVALHGEYKDWPKS